MNQEPTPERLLALARAEQIKPRKAIRESELLKLLHILRDEKHMSFRQVAEWITKHTGTPVSHTLVRRALIGDNKQCNTANPTARPPVNDSAMP